jgi:hypothetical protein
MGIGISGNQGIGRLGTGYQAKESKNAVSVKKSDILIPHYKKIYSEILA